MPPPSPFTSSPSLTSAAAAAAAVTTAGPSALRLLCIPAGLVLTFFGFAVLRPAIVVALALQSASLAPAASGYAGVCASAAFAAAVGLRMAYHAAPAVVGAALGAAVGLSLGFGAGAQGRAGDAGMQLGVPLAVGGAAALAEIAARVVGMGAAFALVFAIVPEEVGIYVTAYGGSYLVWHGLSGVDGEIFAREDVLPTLVSVGSVDMWFNILSFLLVGLIGVCTQIILLRNQRYSMVQENYEYAEIP